MNKDFKSRHDQRSRRRPGGGASFFWFVTGVLVGALAVAVAWMMEGFEDPPSTNPDAPEQTQGAPKPRFDYHSILPEMEVVVPDDEITDRPPALPPPPPPPTAVVQPPAQVKPAPPAAKKAAPSAPPAKGGTSYLLQVASLKNPADADRLKAQLALMGMQVRIQKVEINGQAYHRVRAGPYRGKAAVNKAKAQLGRKGMESITIRLK